MTRTWINGENADTVSAADRGFNYGDGIFETIRVVDNEPTLWNYHRARLLSGAARLKFAIDIDLIEQELQQACKAQGNSVIKLVVTRGNGGRGYMPTNDLQATRVITVHDLPSYPETYYKDGIALHICNMRIGSNSLLAGLKHLNRLEQVLASFEMINSPCTEGLLLDERGRVIEGIRTNFFVVQNNILMTPDLSKSGINGVMREFIMNEIAPKHNIKTETAIMDEHMVLEADELFVCNSVNGIWPIHNMSDHTFKVGSITKTLQASIHPLLGLSY